jgi:hypothetical protein
MNDDDSKTLRSFYCKDGTWEAFEKLAREANCSMDDLLNRAMEYYVEEETDQPLELKGEDAVLPLEEDSIVQDSLRKTQRQAASGSGSRGMQHETFQQLPNVGQESSERSAPELELEKKDVSPNPDPKDGPTQPLYLLFNNNKYLINKDRFIIGRGSSKTDLTIRDGNISRTHCAIISKDGDRYLKDLDSTNGVDYQGRQIHSKKIKDGDIFYLCDYAFQFRYGD